MSKKDAAKQAANQPEEIVNGQEAAAQPAGAPADTATDELEAKLEQVNEELAAQKDLFLRTAAEYDNYRKRTDREKAMVYTDATADTIEKLLPVYDNLERALAQQGGTAEDLRKGVEMVYAQMTEALTKMGVAVIGLEGEPFDPTVHNAVSHIEDEKLGDSVVAEVFQKGYRIGDRIIRHAMVQVAN